MNTRVLFFLCGLGIAASVDAQTIISPAAS